jgi:hypothetical protein
MTDVSKSVNKKSANSTMKRSIANNQNSSMSAKDLLLDPADFSDNMS